ncbi:hypothetical protein BOTBODRAFT_529710 [Botryobasidium botryosum FD-172 SS1]|uniref:BHLH domain-containing protein n=1 Tax=Botryobasidium botryosum (strain FD-172 SS1) TaxID=930990 RepID=A0A067MBY7_BOTB1|nr:hypothetical protein BOTBODRAFT_529710 [Botryobasidium botryosum FD-172 SS1]
MHTGLDGRKTSHKAAEQKRRDSLKAGFDDLRLLLPPITFDPDHDPSEPPIPGSAPPRGPPRNMPGAEDHPNRGVSKLALLRTSNEYIVKLGRRIERRDGAVRILRGEVRRLRGLLSERGLEWDLSKGWSGGGDQDGGEGGSGGEGGNEKGEGSEGGKGEEWKMLESMMLDGDLDAIEKEAEEVRSGKAAARPTEKLAAAVAAAKAGAKSTRTSSAGSGSSTGAAEEDGAAQSDDE